MLAAVFAALFARLNAGEAVTLHLGIATLYRIPFAPLVLAAFLLGMATMFLLGLRHDRRVRRLLRERTVPQDHSAAYASPHAD
ncbi:hypothetical protein BH23GEM5_BH23GEM5_22180 [soil metagenome]